MDIESKKIALDRFSREVFDGISSVWGDYVNFSDNEIIFNKDDGDVSLRDTEIQILSSFVENFNKYLND